MAFLDRSSRGLAVLAIAAWLIAAALGATGRVGAGLAVFCVASLAAFAWTVLRLRRLAGTGAARSGRLVRLLTERTEGLRHLEPAAAAVARVESGQGDLLESISRLEAQVNQVTGSLAEHARVNAALRRELYDVLVTVQRTPSATLELGRLYDRLVAHDRRMPELGDWAMTVSTLTWIVDHITSQPVRTIFECGSGSSTVWFAAALERRGGEGRIISLESSAEYADTTRTALEEFGLSHRATVIHAPPTTTVLPGREPQPWFDLSGMPEDLPPIDLLFVDGPVGGIAPEARYPAFPLLAERLAADAVVVLDDTARPDERSIAQQWQNLDGRHVELQARLDRSMVFRVSDS